MGGKNSCFKKEEEKKKPEPRKHPYEEIDEEQLAANRNNQNGATPNQAELEEDQDCVDGETEIVQDTAPPPRNHPYDEITTEQIEAKRNAVKKKKKQKQPKASSANGKASVATSDSATEPCEVEYQNISTTHAGRTNPFNRNDKSSQDAERETTQATVQLKPNTPGQLNYIEVEFTPTQPKPETKRSYTPTNYMSVVNDNGKVILLNQT